MKIGLCCAFVHPSYVTCLLMLYFLPCPMIFTFFLFFPFIVALCYGNDGKQQGRSPSVIVIGGGMAGIAAARALHNASFQVTDLII